MLHETAQYPRMPHMELTLPAGSLVTAAHALRHGADAVYLGMRSFSARASAKNLSFDELMRVRGLADTLGKQVYVTLNTLIMERELPEALHMVEEIACARADGIIVQDLGLASHIRREFPQLPLHGSTQIAVQTSDGVKALQDLGFSRVVLARELTLEEITSIRESCPDISLKVFIHGALCYGLSGLCLASGLSLGRSANRGACAQICRTWSSIEGAADESASGWWFSMRDLAMKQDVLALRDIGIDSLKVEGRMKSPEYVAAVASYYRALIDGRAVGTEEEVALDSTFSRMTTTGWAGQTARDQGRPDPLTSPDFPGHRGKRIGTIISIAPDLKSIVVESDYMLAPRDGMQILAASQTRQGLLTPHSLGVRDTTLLRSQSGIYTLRLSIAPEHVEGVVAGDPIYLISRHDQTLPDIKSTSLPLWKFPIDVHITIYESRLSLSGTIPCMLGAPVLSLDIPCEPQEAQQVSDIRALLTDALGRSGPGLWTAGQVTCTVHGNLPEDRIFIRPSEIKRIRRTWYSYLEEQWEQRPLWSRKQDEVIETQEVPPCGLLPRSSMTAGIGTELPFITRPALAHPKPISDTAIVLPLSPLQFEGSDYLVAIEGLIRRLHTEYPGHTVLVGLQHIAHLYWAQHQRHRLQETGRVEFFGDLYLYTGNHDALRVYQDLSGGLAWVYQWIEHPDSLEPISAVSGGIPVAKWDPDFLPPSFVSRTCFARDSIGSDTHVPPCTICRDRSHRYTTHQQSKEFRIVVEDCSTYVFQIREAQSGQ